MPREMNPVSGGANAGPGVWSTLASSAVLRILMSGGHDWVGLDLQHGQWSGDAAVAALLTASSPRPAIFVRVEANRAELIGRALDAGAAGVIVPMINSVEEARQAVIAANYPPRGSRSWGPLTGDAVSDHHARPLCLVMIETAAGLSAVREIAAVEGVDGLFVGPYDLALGLNRTVTQLAGNVKSGSPLRRIADAAAEWGIRAAGYGGDAVISRQLRAAGYTMIATTSDATLLADAARADATTWRGPESRHVAVSGTPIEKVY